MLTEIAKETGRLPHALATRPSLQVYLELYLDIFYELSPRRAYTMGGALPIPYAEIKAYLDENGYTRTGVRDRAFHHVMQLDQTFLADRAEKQKQATPLDTQAKR